MKGYNVTFTQYVGCTHCGNTWHEETKHDVGPAVKNSAYMQYNACDRCFDNTTRKRREGFEKHAGYSTLHEKLDALYKQTIPCAYESIPEQDKGKFLGLVCRCPKHTVTC